MVLAAVICSGAYCFDSKNIKVFATNPGGFSAEAVYAEKDGLGFARVTYPEFREGGERFPSMITTLGDGYFDESDFTRYKYLYALVYNPSDITYAYLRMDDKNGRRANYQVPLKPHDYTLCAIETKDIPGIDLTQVCLFDVYYKEPDRPIELWIGDIVLADSIDERVMSISSRKMLEDCEKALKKINGKKGDWCQAKREELQALYALLIGPSSPEKEQAVLTKEYLPRTIDESIDHYAAVKKDAYSVYPMPSTLKLRNDQAPKTKKSSSVSMDAARGESESVSLLVTADTRDLSQVTLSVEPLKDKGGKYIYPEIHPLGYVKVTNPTPAPGGFGVPGMYPDPILPNEPFNVEKDKNVTCLYTVSVPADAEAGTYKGSITVRPEGEKETVIKVTLKVHEVTLLPQSNLKQIFITRNTAANSPFYDQWTPEHFKAFTKLHLKYRLNCQQYNSEGLFDFGRVFTADSKGRVQADWTEFDEQVRYWFGLGMTQFYGFFTGGAEAIEGIPDRDFLRSRLGLLAEHLKKMGWLNRFFLYFYDEPVPEKAEQIIRLCDWVHSQGQGLRIVHTYNYLEQEPFIGHADIIVADIDAFKPDIRDKVREAGGEYWVYTCISNRVLGYPDNWKIDNYGVSHRALGWWIYNNKAQGYLYWGTDFWNVDPWENPETFPRGNGDGSLFYPARDKSSLPYPSLRLDNYRDGVEDYDLLCMLAEYTKDDPLKLLKKQPVEGRNKYSRSDQQYITLHKELLTLLDKQLAKKAHSRK